MFCPKCASPSAEGQRFCRQCGTNLAILVDAMEGKRTALDFDSLKEDLRQLGQSLRSSFEEVHQNFRKTQQFKHNRNMSGWQEHGKWKHWKKAEREEIERRIKESIADSSITGVPAIPVSTKPIPIKIKQVKGGSSRQHSLQQAALSIFGGSAMSAALYYFLNTAGQSGLLAGLEQLIVQKGELQLTGGSLIPVLQALWVFGLIPVAKGFAHLFNGIFFPAKPTENPVDAVVLELNQRLAAAQPPQSYVAPAAASAIPEPSPSSPDTNEFNRDRNISPVASITEDPTERFAPRETDKEQVSR
ncbi:MAG TPA: hypothetical protein VFD58_19170 [Blastocatellia bacterium]|nr:hypothetical protein [Blastocatellia bacterium]